MKIDYKAIKRIAKERRAEGENVWAFDLLALNKNNDPFYIGTPSQMEYARWFADTWQRLGIGGGVHLREVHYRLISQPEPVPLPATLSGYDKKTKQDFETDVYINKDRVWQFMCLASKWARYLGLVPYDAIIDQRAPEIKEFAIYEAAEEPYTRVKWDENGLHFELPDLPDAPSLHVYGYAGRQPYLVEVWIEKSTMNKHLAPLCHRYKVNLVSGEGHMSLTLVGVDFLKRVRDCGKPARILYISDYDEAGLNMPVSVARKIEFFQREHGYDDLDIKLDTVALTQSQIKQYDLPSAPDSWKIELDALQVNHPGLLADITKAAILRYYDTGLQARVRQTEETMLDKLDEIEADCRAEHQDEIDALEKEYAELRQGFDEKAQDIKQRLDSVYDELHAKLEGEEVDLDECPTGEVKGDKDGLLYDSGRDYFEQLDYYKKQKNSA